MKKKPKEEEEYWDEEEEEEEEEEKEEESDFWGEDFGDKELVGFDDLLGEEVIIEGFQHREGTFGDYYSIYLDDDRVVNSGSEGVMSKLDKVVDKLPLSGVFVVQKLANKRRLYSIVSPARYEEILKDQQKAKKAKKTKKKAKG